MLCNRPEACSLGEEGAVSSRAFQGDDSTGVRIEEDRAGWGGGFGLGISLHHLLSLFFFGSSTASLVDSASFDCSSSGALFPLPFITTGCLRMAQRGKNAPGSLCDTVMRGDVVIQQFLPKGHICSLSFCSPYLSESLFIYRGCTLQSLPGHQRVVATHSA